MYARPRLVWPEIPNPKLQCPRRGDGAPPRRFFKALRDEGWRLQAPAKVGLAGNPKSKAPMPNMETARPRAASSAPYATRASRLQAPAQACVGRKCQMPAFNDQRNFKRRVYLATKLVNSLVPWDLELGSWDFVEVILRSTPAYLHRPFRTIRLRRHYASSRSRGSQPCRFCPRV